MYIFKREYAGLGDRQQQNGVNYTLDLSAGLTQVLSDSTNTYLYGNGRISQHATQTEYFLGDALGSVRQLADTTGAVMLTQSYAPYGETVSSVGSGTSVYQFTGESRDANGLTYLRARYYAPTDGRFISRDAWNGDYNRPLSLNRWSYVEGNPVNLVDPSGHIKQGPEAVAAEKIVNELKIYGISIKVDWGIVPYTDAKYLDSFLRQSCGWIEGNWTLGELGELRKGTVDLARAMGGLNKFLNNIGYIDVKKGYTNGNTIAFYQGGAITVSSNKADLYRLTVVHELAHAWDAHYNWTLSEGIEKYTGGHTGYDKDPTPQDEHCTSYEYKTPGCNLAHYYYGGIPAFVSSSGHFDRKEDFAYAVSAYVYPSEFRAVKRLDSYQYKNPNGKYHFLHYGNFKNNSRWIYIRSVILVTRNRREK